MGQTGYTVHRDYAYADAAVKEAIGYGPDQLPINLKPYVKSGCRTLQQMIDTSAADADWANEATTVAYPERQQA